MTDDLVERTARMTHDELVETVLKQCEDLDRREAERERRAKQQARLDAINNFKFDIPEWLHIFTLFSRLPKELQDAIWDASVSDPGMHFMRLVGPLPGWTSTRRPRYWHVPDDADEHIGNQVATENLTRDMACVLVPLEAEARADKSMSRVVQLQVDDIAKLSRAARLWSELKLKKPGTIRLSTDGRIFLRRDVHDVVFLEYLPDAPYRDGNLLAVLLSCSRLHHLRRVAFRFCPEWMIGDFKRGVCHRCGRTHYIVNKPSVLPFHMYQFLARCLPDLEEVWLVDYMMLPRPAFDPKATGVASPRVFRAKDRAFYEADPSTWNVKDRALEIQEWVQKHYVEYARQSPYSVQKKPEKVKFGILGCQFDNVALDTGYPLATTSTLEEPTPKKKRKIARPPQSRAPPLHRRPGAMARAMAIKNGSTSHDQDQYLFGGGKLDDFQFTFELPQSGGQD